jgi:hypothetical protein
MSRENLVPLRRGLAKVATHAEREEPQWDAAAVAEACAEVWPELAWDKMTERSVDGWRGENTVVKVSNYIRSEVEVEVFAPAPKAFGPRWTLRAQLTVPLKRAAAELPKALREARAWWLTR